MPPGMNLWIGNSLIPVKSPGFNSFQRAPIAFLPGFFLTSKPEQVNLGSH